MKHKGLYNILGIIETIIMYVIITGSIIVLMGEPTSGEWTWQFWMMKIVSFGLLYLVYKIEGE